MFFMKRRNIKDKIPIPLRNKYILTIIVFAMWMTFFGKQSLLTHIKLSLQLNEMHNEMERYREGIEKIESERAEMEEDIEKYVREKYFMSKENEDVFVIRRK